MVIHKDTVEYLIYQHFCLKNFIKLDLIKDNNNFIDIFLDIGNSLLKDLENKSKTINKNNYFEQSLLSFFFYNLFYFFRTIKMKI